MTQIERRALLTAGLTAGGALAATLGTTATAIAQPHAAVLSVSAMTAMPDGRLVLADWRAGRLVAVELPAAAPAAEGAFNVTELDAALADAGAALPLRASAMAWHAPSRRAVIALMRLRDAAGLLRPFRGEPTPWGLLLHPLAPWPVGPLWIEAGSELEDACGNRVGHGFEHHAA
jgi:hypothetical protein